MPPKKAKKGHAVEPPVSTRIPLPDAELAKAIKDARGEARTVAARTTPPAWPEDVRYYHTPHYLGGGGQGKAHLWLAVDENERITDRKVVKDVWINPPTWRDVNSWIGNPADPRNRTHREIYFHQRVHPPRSRAGGDFVSRMFYAECYPLPRMGYRLYLQYYPHGDLDDVVKRYLLANEPILRRRRTKAQKRKVAKAKATKKRKATAAETDTQPDDGEEEEAEEHLRIIPEPFLWHVLECLTTACLLLAHGSADPAAPREAAWQQIIHRDIKLDNTYLDAPSQETYPSYPRAVLADLGMAVQTYPNDLRNPIDFVGEEGTDTWQAPEQLPMMHRITYAPDPAGWELGAHTNIWAIGGIVISLMNRDAKLQGTRVADFAKGASEPVICEDVQARYSRRLRELVGRCTRYWPQERIGLSELLAEVRAFTGAGGAGDAGDEGSGSRDSGGEENEEENEARNAARLLRGEEHADNDADMWLLYADSDHPYKRKLARAALRALGTEVAAEDGGDDGDGGEDVEANGDEEEEG